jgi:hypothetical protein
LERASSNRNTASFINRFTNLRNRGGVTASILASASAARFLWIIAEYTYLSSHVSSINNHYEDINKLYKTKLSIRKIFTYSESTI